MTRRRLLNLRFYRQHPKSRTRLYRRMFGRFAAVRSSWRSMRRNAGSRWSVFVALLRALTAKRLRDRFQLRKMPDHYVEPFKSPGRRRVRARRLRTEKAFRARQLERFGLDVTGHGAADDQRKLRNARKRERHAA